MSDIAVLNKAKEKTKELIEIGEIELAKELVEKYKEVLKEDVEVFSIRAVIAMIEGKMKEAEEILLEGYRIDSSNFDLAYNLGYLYEMKSDINEALKYYKRAKISTQTSEQKKDIEEIITRLNPGYESEDKLVKTDKKNKSESIAIYFENTLDKQIMKFFIDRDFQKIIREIQTRITNREYDEVIAICNHWLTEIDINTAIIYYFMGVAANGIKDFQNSLKYHKRALELDSSLADLRKGKSKYQYIYEEKNTVCIGCENEKFEIVNISNQSISEDNKELIDPIRVWVKCKKCGLIYANPIPAEDSLNKYYSLISKEKFGGIYGNIDDRFEFLVGMSNKRLEKIERYVGSGKSLLDIGTGIGIFTGIALDRGWQAEGLELTQEDCQYAKEKFDLDLKQENFYTFKEDRKYDVVTLFEVIEHLQNPLKDLKQINKLIKNDGMLVIATPIQDTLYGKKMKENNVFWNVITHLSYFTKDVMLNYLKEAGFEVIEINGSNEGMGRMEFYCRKINK